MVGVRWAQLDSLRILLKPLAPRRGACYDLSMIKTLHLKLRTSRAHEVRLEETFVRCLLYRNLFLAHGEEELSLDRKYPSCGTQEKLIKDFRPIFDPGESVHTHIFQGAAKRLHLGRAAFFRERKKANKKINLPAMKGKCVSISLKEYGNGFSVVGDDRGIRKLKLSNIGSIPLFGSPRLPKGAGIKTATIKKQTSGYFVSLVYEYEPEAPRTRSGKKQPLFPHSPLQKKPDIRQDVGIDLGIRTFIATSDGDKISCTSLEKRASELRRLNQEKARKEKAHKLSGRKEESRRLFNLRRKIARHHEKTRRVRRDFLRKVASFLVSNYDQIFYEDLEALKMIEKGESKGRGFVRRIHSAAWSSFITILLQRAEGTLSRTQAVDPAWTSCICPYCFNGKRKALSEEKHYCAECGLLEDRDVASAKVIRISGLRPELLSVSKAKLRADKQSLSLAMSRSPHLARSGQVGENHIRRT